jgi:hypothetical protein
LSNPNRCRELDLNNDHALSIREIYDAVQKGVNKLVKDQLKQSQTPYVSNGTLQDDVPVWAY